MNVQPARVLAIVGPTASGKTELAIEIAARLRGLGRDAEIVNADSMLVYRGMDIGTAKPSAAEMAAVRHHLVNVMEPRQSASVADFQKLARSAITDIQRRNALPIVVGGSALYIHAILDEMDFPPTDEAVRAKWESELQTRGPQALYEELERRSPQAAAGILSGNGRRIVRALEVIELTGSFVSQLPEPTYALAGVQQFGVLMSREQVDARIIARVEAMWQSGLVDEVRALEAEGLREGVTASRALGYAQVLRHLAGEYGEAEAKEATIVATRQFSRKQEAWFRRDNRISWASPQDFVATALAVVRQ
ncbi:MAG: tRNA (adenosine(37)-N6)-dimethylallyltransferase MiaA [Propionibacteriaceae bacterium]|jgi:tRNA dimethylallyltransferase|nr:tRNA (adenosine(37)-N6)-dimethylallyltransferase MiaA [Propionibacteriaceae bacterium]